MRRFLKSFLVFSMVFVIGIAVAFAQEEERSEGLFDKLNLELDVYGSFDIYTDYVWRGFVLDRDPVIQPGFGISAYGFTFDFWSSWDASNNDMTKSDEIDYTVDYTFDVADNMSVSLGHIYYDFPAANAYTKEFYVGLGFTETFGLPVESSITYYRDYGDGNASAGLGTYISLDLAYSTTIVEDPEITLDLGAHFGYNRKLFIAGTGYDIGLTAGLTIPLTENLSFSPTINYSIPLSDLKAIGDGNQYRKFYTGFSFAYSF